VSFLIFLIGVYSTFKEYVCSKGKIIMKFTKYVQHDGCLEITVKKNKVSVKTNNEDGRNNICIVVRNASVTKGCNEKTTDFKGYVVVDILDNDLSLSYNVNNKIIEIKAKIQKGTTINTECTNIENNFFMEL
jgi:hypothetical protein